MQRFATALVVGGLVLGAAACTGGGGSSTTKTSKTAYGSGITAGSGIVPKGFPKSDVPLPAITNEIIQSVSDRQVWQIYYKASGMNAATDYVNALKAVGFKLRAAGPGGDSPNSRGYSLTSAKFQVGVGSSTSKGQTWFDIHVYPAGRVPQGVPRSVPLPSSRNNYIYSSTTPSESHTARWSIDYYASGETVARDYVRTLKNAGFTETSSSPLSAEQDFSSTVLNNGKYQVTVLAGGKSGASTLGIRVGPYSSADTSTSSPSSGTTLAVPTAPPVSTAP